MSHKPSKEETRGFPVSGDNPKPDDLKPTNVNPPTPIKPPNQNQKNP
jgi:hypothetical protein